MSVDGADGLASNHRADYVAYGERLRTFGLGFALGGDGVGGLAGLRYKQRHHVRGEDRIAIAPLAGIVDFDGHASQGFNHELAGESGMPTSAAGGDVDLRELAEFVVGHLHLGEEDMTGVLRNAAERGVADGARLLIDFLEHEVLEAAFFRHDRVPGDMLHFALDGLAVEIGNPHTVLRDDREVAVGEKEKIARVRQQRGHVGGDKEFIFAEADDDGRAVAGGDDLVGLVDRDHDEREHASEFFYGFADGIFERGPMAVAALKKVALDEVRDDLGVGFRRELVAFFDQLLFEREVVFDNAVVDNDDLAGAVAMRVRILFRGTAVRCPAGVADAIGAVERLVPDDFLEIAQLAFGAANLEPLAIAGDGDAGRIVAAVLQLAEA